MEILQEKLKEYRRKNNLTQQQISELLEMTQQAYQKIESGKSADIRISTLQHFCKTLGVSADWLLGLND